MADEPKQTFVARFHMKSRAEIDVRLTNLERTATGGWKWTGAGGVENDKRLLWIDVDAIEAVTYTVEPA